MENLETYLQELQASDPARQQHALKKLGRLGNRRAIPDIIPFLKASHPAVRGQAVAALERLPHGWVIPALLPVLQDDRPDLRAAAMRALWRVDLWLRIFEYVSGDGRVHEALLQALDDPDAKVVMDAIEIVSKADWFGLPDAMEALGILGDRRAVKPLLDMLPRRNLTHVVAEALGRLGDRVAVEPLLQALQSAPAYPLEIVVALGRLGDRRAIGPVIAAIARRGKIDFESMEALGGIGAITVLEGYLQHPEVTIRYRAVKALGAVECIGEERQSVFHVLLQARQDPEGIVRKAATRRLKKLVVRSNGFLDDLTPVTV